jgi:putative ABC transport system substrate-binding protein
MTLLAPALLAAPVLLTGLAHARDAVVVLTSDDLPRYEAPLPSLERGLGRPVQVLRIRGSKQTALSIAADLGEDPPPLVIALGAKAAWTAVHQGPNVPIVWAMVDDPDRYDLTGAFVTGINGDVPPDLVLAQLRLFAPEVERIGIVIGAGNTSPRVGAAIDAAKAAGYEVTARRVGTPRDVARAFARLRGEIDALWILPDRDVIDPNAFHHLRREAERARMPVLAWSPMLVEAGALMCVAPDPDRVGAQAAELASRVLAGETAGAIEPIDPDGARVVINRDTMETINLAIDEDLLDFVDEVVRKPSTR